MKIYVMKEKLLVLTIENKKPMLKMLLGHQELFQLKVFFQPLKNVYQILIEPEIRNPSNIAAKRENHHWVNLFHKVMF